MMFPGPSTPLDATRLAFEGDDANIGEIGEIGENGEIGFGVNVFDGRKHDKEFLLFFQ